VRVVPLAFLVVVLVVAATAEAQVTNGTTRFRGERPGQGPQAQLALVAFVVAGAFVPLNLARRLYVPKLLAARHEKSSELSRASAWLKKSGVWWHMGFGAATLAVGTWHGLTARASNWELWAGMALLAVLLVLGTVIHWRWVPWLARQRAAMFWTKWGVTLVALGLLLYGHAIAHPPRPPGSCATRRRARRASPS
jgi:hypothetical protein